MFFRPSSRWPYVPCSFFFFNDTATTEIYTLSLHDALPISRSRDTGSPHVTEVLMLKRTHLVASAVLVVLLACLVSAQQQRAVDGVTLNDEGLPQYSTFSLCAIDPATGQSGASVTTRVPFVGRAVPHVRAGVGAVCTQASAVVEYGQQGLDLMARGVLPADAIQQLLSTDDQRESRQLGMIDMQGRSAAHT